MKTIKINSDLDSYLQSIKGLKEFPSALAVLDNNFELLFSNTAFDEFNNTVKDSQDNVHGTEKLFDLITTKDWLVSTRNSLSPVTYNSTFYYSKNICVKLSLLSTPIVNNNDILGRLITIADESISYDRYHLARSQESNDRLKKRIINLDQEKIKSERLLDVLLKKSPFALLIFNQDQQVILSNKKSEELFAKSAKQMLGQHCSTFVNCYQATNSCKANCKNYSIQAEEVNGVAVNYENMVLLRSTQTLIEGDQTLIVEAYIDITPVKKAESEIKKLDEINSLLVNSTGEGIVSIDKDLTCNFINKAGLKIMGYSDEEFVGKNIRNIFSSNEDEILGMDDHASVIMSVIRTSESKNIEGNIVKKNGELVPIQYLCNALHNEDGTCSGAVIVFRNVSEAKATAKKLDYLATHDALTGLLNRYAFEIRLSNLLEERNLSDAKHILCFIDLDQFKIINDTAGHLAGDELLKQVAGIIHQNIRNSDVLSRLGGDEYGLLLTNCSLEKSTSIIEKILSEIIEYRFSWNDNIFTVGASIGMVELNNRINTVSSAMNAADSACYISKVHGRRRIHIYSEDDDDIEQHKLEFNWVNKIKKSLVENKFVLWQQPICDIRNIEDRQHFEILIRLIDDETVIFPDSFIPTAERYNLMKEIDLWVVEQVIKYLNSIELNDKVLLSVNLSGQSISDDLFVDLLQNMFTDNLHLTSHICFEVTETAAISNLTKASEFMKTIKKLGFTFALDDFGSGMSSFAYLKNLPIDYLKIDGNFIRNIENDDVDHAMVEAINSVGKVMGIKTIAEFVENDGIIRVLKKIGIDYIQGYAIAKPSPLE